MLLEEFGVTCDVVNDGVKAHVLSIIALTAKAMSDDKEKFFKLGISGYVSKLIDDEELYKSIKILLNK